MAAAASTTETYADMAARTVTALRNRIDALTRGIASASARGLHDRAALLQLVLTDRLDDLAVAEAEAASWAALDEQWADEG